MVPFKLGYSLREAGSHLTRNVGTSIGAVVTIFLSLFIIGVFAIITMMVNNMMGDVESRITIQAFLADDADSALVASLQDEIKDWDGVADVTYKSKDEALQEYRDTMVSANAQDAVAALDGRNPIPASIVIKLSDADMAETVAGELMNDSTFARVCDSPDTPASSVQYGAETVDRLLSLTNAVRLVAVALVVLLIFVAFVFINNTIRLSIMARSTEIGIMRLVGASNSFIRGPFLTEGVIQALIGFLLAMASLGVFHHVVMPKVTNAFSFLYLSVADQAYYVMYAALLVLALVIGLGASAIAMRRYLKI